MFRCPKDEMQLNASIPHPSGDVPEGGVGFGDAGVLFPTQVGMFRPGAPSG